MGLSLKLSPSCKTCLLMGWIEVYKELVNFLDKFDKERTLRFEGQLERKFVKLGDILREELVLEIVGSELKIAENWVTFFKRTVTDTIKSLGLTEILMSRELKSFVSDPMSHLKKKIIFYVHDLLRGVTTLEDFEKKAFAAVRTSLKTNMRTVYQDWIFLSLLILLAKRNGRIEYPEHGVLSLERSGKQKIGWIPPNAVIHVFGKGYLSFFIEAPRPIGWGDSKDLEKIWSLYTALRPDMMVYGERVMNIVELSSSPPIKRPDIIIECKELEDWFLRIREVRGPFAKPMTVETWRSKWIEGLWDGLAGILGVERKKVKKEVEERKAIRLRDVNIVKLYNSLYKPKIMIIISRTKTPRAVKRDLGANGIKVIDNVGFNLERLDSVCNLLLKNAGGEEFVEIRIKKEVYAELERIAKSLGVSMEQALETVVKRFPKSSKRYH